MAGVLFHSMQAVGSKSGLSSVLHAIGIDKLGGASKIKGRASGVSGSTGASGSSGVSSILAN